MNIVKEEFNAVSPSKRSRHSPHSQADTLKLRGILLGLGNAFLLTFGSKDSFRVRMTESEGLAMTGENFQSRIMVKRYLLKEGSYIV